MKPVFLAMTLCAALSAPAAVETASAWVELKTLFDLEMQEGFRHHSLMVKSWQDRPELRESGDRLRAIHAKQEARLTALLDRHGWPGRAEDDGHATILAFRIIERAEPVVRRRYVPLMRQAQERGDISGAALAEFEDKLLVQEGQRQRYGSVTSEGADGKRQFAPIEDEDEVDSRRLALGMEPMMAYARRLGLRYPPDGSNLTQERCPSRPSIEAPALPNGKYRLVVRFLLKADGSIQNLRVHSAGPAPLTKAVASAVAAYQCLPAEADQQIALDFQIEIS